LKLCERIARVTNMINTYKLGKAVFKRNSHEMFIWHNREWVDSEVCCNEAELIAMGATPIETESECKCKTCSTDKCDTCVMGMGWEDENTKEEYEKIKGYVLSKAVREAEREEIEHGVCCNKTLAQCNCGSEEHDRYAPIKMPEVNMRFITGELLVNETFIDWMRQVTDTLNRHERLLRNE
jgi:hypothetical protein